MSKLEYQISVTGVENTKAALKGLERSFVAHEKAVSKARNSRPKQLKSEADQTIKGIASIGKVARAADLKAHRERLRMIAKEKNAAIRAAKQEATARLREAKKAEQARIRFAQRTAGRITRSATGAIGGLARYGAGAVALAGGLTIGDSVRRRISASTVATGIANRAAAVPGETRSRAQLRDEILGKTRGLETQSGRDQSVILEGMDKFLDKTGDIRAASSLTDSLLKLADAVGLADDGFADLSEASGIVYAGNIAQGMSAEEAAKSNKKVMRSMAAQSALGQISVADLAKELPKLVAASSRFGGDAGDNLAKMVALSNISVSQASSDAPEAATAAVRFTDDLIQNQKKFKRIGVNVFDKNGNIRDSNDIIRETIAGTGGKLPELKKLFGARGIKMIEGFATQYRNADDKKGALNAIEKQIKRLSGADLTDKQVEAGAGFTRGSDARKLKSAMADIQQAFADELTPVLMNDLLPALKELAPHAKEVVKALAKFVSWFAENPIKGIGAVVLGAVAKDLAGAAIGAGIKGALSKAIQAASGGGGGGMGAAGLGLTIGTITAGTILTTGINSFEEGEQKAKDMGKALNAVRDKSSSPEVARRNLEFIRRQVTEQEKDQGSIGNAALNFITGGDQDQQLATSKAMLAQAEAAYKQKLDSATNPLLESYSKLVAASNSAAKELGKVKAKGDRPETL